MAQQVERCAHSFCVVVANLLQTSSAGKNNTLWLFEQLCKTDHVIDELLVIVAVVAELK